MYPGSNKFLFQIQTKLKLRKGIWWFYNEEGKVEKIQEDSLDSIPSPSVKIQVIGGKVYLR